MKGSAVAMGFKALASKLHPQLPLSPRESQRLLTALTSSFRKHLDEAHPSTAEDKASRTSQVDPLRPAVRDERSLRSSAAHADQHMSNVLTLFSQRGHLRPASDRLSRLRKELAAGADPLDVLEDYEKRGVADFNVANECLSALKSSLDNKDYATQAEIVQEMRAGSRALGWLWYSDRHTTAEFVDQTQFMILLARFVQLEGREVLLWDWLQLDMKGPVDEDTRARLGPYGTLLRECYWKTRLLRAMVRAPLLKPHAHRMSLDPALHIFLRTTELQGAGHLEHVRISPALEQLIIVLAAPGRQFHRTNPKLMDRLLQYIALKHDSHTKDYNFAIASVHNPVNPDPNHALAYLKAIFSKDEPEYGRRFRAGVAPNSDSRAARILNLRRWNFMAATSSVLKAQGRHQDAAWVRKMLVEATPTEHKAVQSIIDSWNKHFSDTTVEGRAAASKKPHENTPELVTSFPLAPAMG